eukprot:scaffold270_cov390-Prasinococcus_capsulatus_cf.AAC.8
MVQICGTVCNERGCWLCSLEKGSGMRRGLEGGGRGSARSAGRWRTATGTRGRAAADAARVVVMSLSFICCSGAAGYGRVTSGLGRRFQSVRAQAKAVQVPPPCSSGAERAWASSAGSAGDEKRVQTGVCIRMRSRGP